MRRSESQTPDVIEGVVKTCESTLTIYCSLYERQSCSQSERDEGVFTGLKMALNFSHDIVLAHSLDERSE